ncbi:MAG: c-type cytochrome [Bryobacteraceae bacterium]
MSIAIGLSLPSVACYAQQNPPSHGRDVTKLYTEYCASCHGTDLAGGSASSLVDGVWRYGGNDASVAASIGKGHPAEGMPPMEKDLNAPEIRGLVIYLRERADKVKTAQTQFNAPLPGAVVRSEKASCGQSNPQTLPCGAVTRRLSRAFCQARCRLVKLTGKLEASMRERKWRE